MAKEIGREFLIKTQYQYLEPSDQVLKKSQPPLTKAVDESETLFSLPLPTEMAVQDVNLQLGLQEAIENRNSVRNYTTAELSLTQLSYLLWSTQGVKQVMGQAATLRIVPSAGARHALETYLLVNRVHGLETGIYRFLPLEHKLTIVKIGQTCSEIVTAACLNQEFVRQSAVTFIWSAVPYRMTWRYGERGYRYLYLDAGHTCQNLYLAAEAVDCGVCAIGAFLDEQLNEAIGVNGLEEFAIYAAAVGKKLV